MPEAPVIPGLTETASGPDVMKLLFMLAMLHRRDPDMVTRLLSGIARMMSPKEPQDEEGMEGPVGSPIPPPLPIPASERAPAL